MISSPRGQVKSLLRGSERVLHGGGCWQYMDVTDI